MGYSEVLYKKIMKYLKAGDVENAAKQMDLYGISKSLLEEQISDCRAPFGLQDDFKLLDSQVKRQLTTMLKDTEKFPNQPSTGAGIVKRKREKKEKGLVADLEQEMDRESSSDEDSEVEENIDDIIKAAKVKAKAKAKGKAKARKLG